jgi:hypothetical protein
MLDFMAAADLDSQVLAVVATAVAEVMREAVVRLQDKTVLRIYDNSYRAARMIQDSVEWRVLQVPMESPGLIRIFGKK